MLIVDAQNTRKLMQQTMKLLKNMDIFNKILKFLPTI